MKQKLRVGERYALSKHKRKQTTIRYISLLAVLMSMCLYAVKQVSAQGAEPAATAVADIKPLQIGDTIPEYLWQLPLQVVNHPEGKDTITLNDYRGELIILDFWATWCSACLEGFPRMDSLKKAFSDQLAILLINSEQTGDNLDRVKRTFENRKTINGYEVTLPYIVGDTVFQQFFPHWILPHYVWISPKGKFEAATFSKEMTAENVYAAISGKKTEIHIKQDFLDFDAQSMSLVNLIDSQGAEVKFHSLLTGYIEGLGTKNGTVTTKDGQTRIFKINVSLGTLYNTIFSTERGRLPPNQLIFEIPDFPNFEKKYYEYGEYANRYCYELITPIGDEQALMARMKRDLADYFNVYMERQTRRTSVIVVQASKPPRKISESYNEESIIKDGHGTVLKNKSIRYFLTLLNRKVKVPVISKSSDLIPINIRIPNDIESYSTQKLEKWLAQNGFTVSLEKRKLEYAVFKQKS